MRKIDLNFSKQTDNTYEAIATGVKGAWQLYIELPEPNALMRIFTRASEDEKWDIVHTRYSSPTVDTIPFMSIITENVKIETDALPVKANIRMEE